MNTWPPPILNSRAAADIEVLFLRGREAFKEFLRTMPKREWPLGGLEIIDRFDVITADDFDKHAAIIRMHVCENHRMIRILDGTGKVCSLIEPIAKSRLY